MRILAITVLYVLSFATYAQISGSSSIAQNASGFYTYDAGLLYLGGVNWTASNGTVITSAFPSGGSTTYTATLSFQSTGTQTITARRSNGTVLATKTVTVTSPPLSAGSIGGSQTVASGGTAPTLQTSSSAASGGSGSYAYQWQRYVTSWTNVSGATESSYQPPVLYATTPGISSSTVHYRRRVISGGQTRYSNATTITIRNVNAGSISGTQTICYEQPPALTSTAEASNGIGSYAYQWQYSTNGTSYANISGQTGPSYNPGALTASRWYRRRVISAGATEYTNSVQVTVRSNLNAGSIGGAQTLCFGENPTTISSISAASGSAGTYQYQWQYSTNGSSGWTNISGETGTAYDPGVLISSRWFRRRVRTSTCDEYRYTSSVKVTTHSFLNAGTIGNPQTVCYNGDPVAFTSTAPASGSSGSYQYQWQYSTNGTSGWTNASGASTGTAYNPGNLTSSRWFRRRVRTSTCDEYKYTSTVKVTVHSNLQAGVVGNPQTICYNGDPVAFTNVISASGSSGSYQYQWQYSANGTSGWTNASGATSTSSAYNPGSLTASRWYRRRVRTSTCGDYRYTGTVKVTVYNNLSAGSIGGAQTVCYNGDPTTLTNTGSPSGGNGSYQYQWQISSNGSSGWTNVSGATSSTYNPGLLTASRWYRRRANATSCTDLVYTSSVKVTVRSPLNPGSIGNVQTVCYGGDAEALTSTSAASGGNGSYSYQWQHYISGTWQNISGETSATYDPPALTLTRPHRRSVSSCGQTAISNQVNVWVLQQVDAGTIGNPQTVCYGEDPAALTQTEATGGNGSYTYQWQASPNGTSSWTNVSGQTNASFDPGPLTSSTWYRRRVQSSDCAFDYTGNVEIAVYQNLTAGTISGTQTICYNETPGTLSSTATATGGNGHNYQWQERPAGGSWANIPGGTSGSYTPTDPLTATTEYRRVVTSCGQTDETTAITVTVRSSLDPGEITGSQTICTGETAFPFSSSELASGGDESHAYQWQYLNAVVWTDIGGATSSSYTPGSLDSPSSGTTQYRRVVSSCGQTVNTMSESLTIISPPAAPTVSAPATVDPVTLVTFSTASSVARWYTTASGGTAFHIGTSHSETITTNTTYYVSAFNGTCESLTRTPVTVLVNLYAGNVTSAPQSVCYGCDPAVLTVATPTGGDGTYAYQWERWNPLMAQYDPIDGETEETFDPPALTIPRTYQRRVESGSLISYSDPILVDVRPQLNPGSILADQSVCDGAQAGAFTNVPASGGDSNYLYQWEFSTVSASGPWNPVPGATDSTFNYTDPVTADLWFKRVVSSDGQTDETNVIELTHISAPGMGTISGQQHFCGSGTIDLSYSGIVSDHIWEVQDPGGSWIPVISEGESILASTNLSWTAFDGANYRVTRTYSCGTTSTGVTTITVQPLDKGVLQAPSQTFCGSANTTISLSGNAGSIAQWEESTDDGVTWVAIGNAGQSSLTLSNETVTKTYRVLLNFSGCPSDYSDNLKITVYPNLTAGTITGMQTICYNETPSELTGTTAATGGNGHEYQWQERVAGGTWMDIIGQTNQSYTPGALTTSMEYKRVVSSCDQTVETDSVVVTVLDPLDPGNITGSQTICVGGSASAFASSALPSGGDGAYEYQWQYLDAVIWQDISGATDSIYTAGSLDTPSVGATLYRRVVSSCGQTVNTLSDTLTIVALPSAPIVSAPSSVDPGTSVNFIAGSSSDQWYAAPTGGAPFHTGSSYVEVVNLNTTYYVSASNGSCESLSRTGVSVSANLLAGDITSPAQAICYGCDPTPLAAAGPQGGNGSYTYQWEWWNPLLAKYDTIATATGITFDPPALFAPRTYRRAVASAGAVAYSAPFVVAVRDQLTAGTITGDQSLCDGELAVAFGSTLPQGGDSNYLYQWEVSTSNTPGSWTAIAAATSATFTHPDPITQDLWFRRIVHSDNQSDTTDAVKLTYLALPAMGTIAGPSNFCGLGLFDFSYTGSVTDHIWEVQNSSTTWVAVTDSEGQVIPASTNLTGPTINGTSYRVTRSHSCGSVSTAATTIVVQSLNTGTLSSPSKTYFGQANTTITLTGNVGSIVQWEESVDDGATWTIVGGTGAAHVITNEVLTKSYRTLIGFPWCSDRYTPILVVNVEAAGFAGYITGPTEVHGTSNSGTLSLNAQAGAGTTTRWYSSLTGLGGWNEVATSTTYTFLNLSQDTFFKAEYDVGGQTFTSDSYLVEFLPAIVGDIVQENYVKTTSLLAPETDLANVAAVSAADKLVSYTYVDGLGRGIQSVNKNVTPTGGDIISFTEIQPADATVARAYLPFASSGSDYYADPAAAQATYYATAQPGMETETHPFAETQREASPRGLVLEQGAPGADWQLGSGHTVQHGYRFNTAGEVTKFDIDNIQTTGTYEANSLNVRETTDENGNGVRVFTNARGQTVLKQVEQQAGTYASTANVYDIMGRLRYVFPPKAMNYIAANSGWTIATLKDNLDLIFEYTYDGEGRLIERKVPGKGLEYLVYDPYERVALTQDAIMRARNQWAFSKYDEQGRTVYSGLHINDSTRAEFQAKFDLLDYDGGDAYYETWDGSTYSNTVQPTQNLEIHIENYYDTYEFQTGSADEMNFSNPDARYSVQTDGTSQYIALNQYYDQPNSIDEVTVEAWIKTDYAGSSWTANWAIVDFDRSEFYNLFVHGVNGRVGFSTKGGNINDFYSVQSVNDGLWHHVAAVFDGTNKRIYIDGVLDNEIANPHSGTLLGTTRVRYGFIGDGSEATSFNGNRNNRYFQGDIGEVRIWHDVRSETEISNYKDLPLTGNEADLVGMWTMNDMSEGLEDQTGNGYDGTLINGPTQQTELKPGGLPLLAVAAPRGLPTGSKVKEDDGWRNTVVYYDEDDQVIQTQSTNHLGGMDISSNFYETFTGQLTKQISHHDNGSALVQTVRRYEYDSRLRATRVYHQLDANPEVLLTEYTYSDLGQVIEKNIGDDIQSIDYTFNSRGWLTAINESDLSGGDGDVFGQELFYNVAEASLGNTANYNGNISGMKWSSFAESNDVTERGYAYGYDKADRLTDASHLTKDIAWSTTNAFEVSGIQYDGNGNITNLNRTDAAEATADALSYTYQGNRLLTVGDTGTGEGFADGNTVGDDYGYDVNGNVVQDLNKGIDSIVYNHLDLPTTVTLQAGHPGALEGDSLTYLYDAVGTKLRMEVWKDGAVATKTDYVGGMRYENDTLRTIAHEEGRIVMQEDSEAMDYQYTLTDHQGNTRRVLSSLLEVYETTEDFEGINNGFTDEHYFTRAIANSTLPLASNDGVGLFQSGNAGAMIMLRMDRGDTIDLSVNANYEAAPTDNTFLGTAFGSLFNSWDGAYGTGAEGGGITGVSNTVFDDALGGVEMAAKSGTSTAPRAYLNYIFFDLDMNYQKAGYVQISTSALGTGVHENIAIDDIISDQAGYLLAYLSNENQEAVNIHFDDFTVKHSKTNVVQAVDYYPFGAVASSYTRTAADPTKYLYNAGAELNDLTGYYETFFRNYDATIGRFNGVDVAVGKYKSQTPYNYAFNDPVALNDPMGDDVYGCTVCNPDNSTFVERFNSGGLNGAWGTGGSSYGSIGWGNAEAGWNAYKANQQAQQGTSALWTITSTLLGTEYGGSWNSSNPYQLNIFGSDFTGVLAGSIYNSDHNSWANTHSGSWGRSLASYRTSGWTPMAGLGFQPFELGSIGGGPNLTPVVLPNTTDEGVTIPDNTGSRFYGVQGGSGGTGLSNTFSRSGVIYDGWGATVTGTVSMTEKVTAGDIEINSNNQNLTFSTRILDQTFKINLTALEASRTVHIDENTSYTQTISKKGFGFGFGKTQNNMTFNLSLLATPKQRDLGLAAVIVGGGIVIFDVATVPSGEGAVGVQMIRWGLGF